MSENESSWKKERMVYNCGRDRLSELPSSMIDIILSFLPSKDAVRMSILSKQFRYKWINLPQLVFDLSEFRSMEHMEKFLTNFLKLHKGPIHKFGMSVLMLNSWLIVDKWLPFLHEKEIREFILKLDSCTSWNIGYFHNWLHVFSVPYSFSKLTHLELDKCPLDPPPLTFTGFVFLRCLILVAVKISLSVVEIVVDSSPLLETLKLYGIWSYTKKSDLRIRGPNLKCFEVRNYQGACMQIHSTYSFSKLTRLELQRCDLGPPPLTFTGFLFLRCLILVDVNISLNDVESVVANSPLIETLKVVCSSSDIQKAELRISAPNLQYFDLGTYPGDCMQIYFSSPFLAEMCVKVIGIKDGYLQENHSTYNYTNFFGGLNNLQILKGNYFTKVMSYGVDSCQYSFLLPCLEVIELNDVEIGVVKQMSYVARIVTGAPNLQKLKLTFDPSKEKHASEADPDVSYMDFLRASNFKWKKLRIITMCGLTGFPTEIEFLKLLLENSPALEGINLYTSELKFQESEDLRAEVLKCNFASPNFTLWDLLVI